MTKQNIYIGKKNRSPTPPDVSEENMINFKI